MHFLRGCLFSAVFLAAGACGGSVLPPDTAARPVSGAPSRFLFDATGFDPDTMVGRSACRSPLVDPNDGTRLILARSDGGRGDYRVPRGRYGVGAGDLLRINCKTGAVIGIVGETA